MKVRSLSLVSLFTTAMLAGVSRAAAIPVSVDVSSIYSIQTYNVGEKAVDQTHLLVDGVAAGKAIDARFPQSGTWPAAPKQQPIENGKPLEIWKGELDDGQYAVVTISLMQGKGENAALNKQFTGKLTAAASPAWSKPTLASDDEMKKVATDTLKANKSVVTKIKDLYSREKNTDHFGGQFTLVVWNHGGKLMKRVDPVGLTFGEDNGVDVKIYSKLKLTRNNVIAKNEKGQWEMVQLEPTNDDSTEIRVKALETEMIPQPGGNPVRHVTDYLIGLQVLGPDGKPVTWTTEDQQNNEDNIHVYWNYAD
ncbi:MAG TPA: hypothetical protein VK797_17190 [Tepidisphaeraceae bacterium]|jgi:hypothetical protein|nr:hypothetical protein [Tepidisphaeraceae bacterium]